MAGAAYVAVGRVAGPHGVEGALKVAPFSGDPSGMLRASSVRLSRKAGGRGPAEERDFEVRAARPQGGCAVFSLAGIASPEEARTWAGAVVSVRREDLPAAGEDEYYWVDLVGCAVVDPAGTPIGTVSRVEGGAAHDWLVVDRGGEEALLPMVGTFVLDVDVGERRIVASPPPGW